MPVPTERIVTDVLKTIDSGTGALDIVTRRWVKSIRIKDGDVTFALEVPAKLGPVLEPVRAAAEKAVMDLPGVISVTAVLTAETQKPAAPTPAKRDRIDLPSVSHVVAVASGKGGVGKSTVAANLAVALARL